MEAVKDRILNTWIKYFLKKTARRNPKMFNELMSDIGASKRQKEIMQLRYIEELSFKEIAFYGLSQQQINTMLKDPKFDMENFMRPIFFQHKKVIDTLRSI